MSFAVVKFVESNQVAAVPVSWLFEDQCYWPPESIAPKVSKRIEKGIPPDESWKLYKTYILGLYGSYSETVPKTIRAQEKSDLETTDAEKRGKGKRMKKKRVFSPPPLSSSDDETCLPETPKLSINRPIVEKVTIQNETDSLDLYTVPLCDINNEPSTAHGSNDSLELYTIENNPEPIAHGSKDTLNLSQHNLQPLYVKIPDSCDRSKDFQESQNSLSQSLLSETENFNQSLGESQNFSESLLDSAPPSTGKELEITRSKKDYLVKILRNQAFIKLKLKKFEEKLDTISSALNGDSKSEGKEDQLPSSMTSLLPIKKVEDLMTIEEKLTDSEMANKMILYLQRVGGGSCCQVVRSLLKKLISDDVAVNYSFKGQRGKQPFKNLNLCRIIMESVRNRPEQRNVLEKDIENAICNWLRHSKSRLLQMAPKINI